MSAGLVAVALTGTSFAQPSDGGEEEAPPWDRWNETSNKPVHPNAHVARPQSSLTDGDAIGVDVTGEPIVDGLVGTDMAQAQICANKRRAWLQTAPAELQSSSSAPTPPPATPRAPALADAYGL